MIENKMYPGIIATSASAAPSSASMSRAVLPWIGSVDDEWRPYRAVSETGQGPYPIGSRPNGRTSRAGLPFVRNAVRRLAVLLLRDES